ncbi:PREDICTED: calmodulin-binding protein 25-like [Tarenaya hassleriana]|uniref:calmodulin-binding protein 25-like n=1 Tax=Tarenaya hassleriana TaxID=28532 RepID=UPI00053C85B7|nr:PREDICTED: calmodulin-binding protein 25-like [Tarenaya hassleriana]
MASSEGLASAGAWSFKQSFGIDSWLLPESNFSRDNDLLARALHKSISTTHHDHNTLLLPDPLSPSAISEPSPALSNVSCGSYPEISGTKRKRNGGSGVAGPSGKPPKRRSRTSKKSQTTFITADPSNFRQMVQQVTGAKYIGSSHNIFSPIVKPEAKRFADQVQSDRSGLPTLDTSGFLSNHHQESLAAGNNAFSGDEIGLMASPITLFPPCTTADAGGSAAEFDNYPSFPTLESWKVM